MKSKVRQKLNQYIVSERKKLNASIMGRDTSIRSVKKIYHATVPFEDYKIPIRIYEPEGDGPFPLLLFIHGAGWIAGNLDTHDNVCRSLSSGVGCVVISIDYRLAPENKFPIPVDEAYQVYDWSLKNHDLLNIDLERIAICGDSAGGNIAAGVCLAAKHRKNSKIKFQVLVNPALDLSAYEGDGFERMKWFRDQYIRDHKDITNPYASPLLAKSLEELPSAFIVTCENDILKTEGDAYAERLRNAGVNVKVSCLENKGHLGGDFARATIEAEEAVKSSISALKGVFNCQ
jgi:acetyl esterase